MKKGQFESHILILVTLGLTAFGLVMVYSATSAPAALGGGDPGFYLKRQAIYAVIGIALLVIASRTDFRTLRYMAPILVLTSAFLCLAVLGVGEEVNGARRWLTFGPLTFQPSELAKISLAIWAAAYLARHRAPRSLGELARPIGLTVGAFCALILIEPDLGTVIALVVVVGTILIVSGVPIRVLAGGGSIMLAVGIAAIWATPYRRERFFAFLDPWQDPQGTGYQTVQAMMGLASGGIFGTGVGQGVSKNSYLPEAHTDMIFAIIGEELGLIGTSLVIGCLRGARLRGPARRAPVQGSVREAARGGDDRAHQRSGADQSGSRPGTRAADRNHAPVRVLWRVEPGRFARRSRCPP